MNAILSLIGGFGVAVVVNAFGATPVETVLAFMGGYTSTRLICIDVDLASDRRNRR